MSDIYLDPSTGDLDLVNGDFRLCESKAELARQEVYITLNVNRGSWLFNIRYGLPWLSNEYSREQLIGKNPPGLVDSRIKAAILEQDYVLSIRDYESSLNRSTRVLHVYCVMETPEGDIPLELTV